MNSAAEASTDGWHLAQFNMARMRYPLDDPRMAEFVANLDPINTLGDESPGWVWRHSTESGSSTDERVFDDDTLLLNYTIWEDVESLRNYTYKSEHKEFLRRRREWFVSMPEWPIVVLWWVPAGTVPSLEEATEKLVELRDNGPTPHAFSFREQFPPPAAE